jgi:hypothetical protein
MADAARGRGGGRGRGGFGRGRGGDRGRGGRRGPRRGGRKDEEKEWYATPTISAAPPSANLSIIGFPSPNSAVL